MTTIANQLIILQNIKNKIKQSIEAKGIIIPTDTSFEDYSTFIDLIKQGENMFKGVILMYSGLISEIPEGWAICDGTSGTPNLVDKFIRGVATQSAMNITGGANSVNVSLTPSGTVGGTALTTAHLPSHNHASVITSSTKAGVAGPLRAEGTYHDGDGNTKNNVTYVAGSTGAIGSGGAHTHSFIGSISNTSVSTVPAYYTLAFIIKL